ncbi:hypothetical protein N8612_07595, partial [Verrucomicrobia bacterium]|nr:hypothetical protein [Verrucomicrobiota bacterium]
HKEMAEEFSLQLDQDLLAYECMAMLGSIVLHQAHSKTKQASAVDINLSYGALKESLRKMSIDDPQKQKYAAWFNDETFHNLIASYFIGVLAGFHFSQEEIQDTSTKYGMEIPTAPGIDVMFFGLLVRLFRMAEIAKINGASEQQKAGGRIIQIAETGISTFGLELQTIA